MKLSFLFTLFLYVCCTCTGPLCKCPKLKPLTLSVQHNHSRCIFPCCRPRVSFHPYVFANLICWYTIIAAFRTTAGPQWSCWASNAFSASSALWLITFHTSSRFTQRPPKSKMRQSPSSPNLSSVWSSIELAPSPKCIPICPVRKFIPLTSPSFHHCNDWWSQRRVFEREETYFHLPCSR